MSENKKPRLAEILGVEVGEKFDIEGRTFSPYMVTDKGFVIDREGEIDYEVVTFLLNDLSRLIRRPRWTEQDKEDARKIKAIFPDDYSLEVGRLDDGRLKLFIIQGLSFVLINDELLPSLKPGESATLNEIIGGRE